jgi:septum formation protein
MLSLLQGAEHVVTTAFALTAAADGAVLSSLAVNTRVRFRTLADRDIAAYLDTPEPWDKAGAYAIQGLAGLFIEAIEGSFTNVVGLPVSHVVAELRRVGALERWPWEEAP